MKLKNRLYFLIILFGSVLLYRCDSPNSEVDFSSQVKPLLNAKCISCHGGVKKNAGFSVLFEEEAMASLALGLVFIHIAGVIVMSLVEKQNLAKSMLTGLKKGS